MVVEPDFEALFRRSYADLVRALTAAAGREEAADAVQEAFLAAYREWATVGTYDVPVAWVRRVAVRRLLNVHRSVARRDRALARIGPYPSDHTTEEPYVDGLDLVDAVA